MNKNWNKPSLSLTKSKKSKQPDSPVIFEDEPTQHTPTSTEKRSSDRLTPTGRPDSLNGHSTPIKMFDKSSDSPEIAYSESPIETLTQHPANEVVWDFQHPFGRENDLRSYNSFDVNRTPKRSAFISKRKNSNSPLLCKPLKKKLIADERKENMKQFMEDLQKVNQKVEERQKSLSTLSDAKLQAPASDDDQNNDLSDDDDDLEMLMVKCTQQVEKEFDNNQHSTSSFNGSEDKNASKTSPESSMEKMTKTVSQLNVAVPNNTSGGSKGSNSIEIPDDSYDDLFADIDIETIDNRKKQSTVQQYDLQNSKASFGYLTSNANNVVLNKANSGSPRLYKAKSFSDTQSPKQTYRGKTFAATNQKQPGFSKQKSESSFDLTRRSDSSSSVSEVKLCTQEEIEKKRRLALEKRKQREQQRIYDLNRPNNNRRANR